MRFGSLDVPGGQQIDHQQLLCIVSDTINELLDDGHRGFHSTLLHLGFA